MNVFRPSTVCIAPLVRGALFLGTSILASLPMAAVYPLIGFDLIYFLPRLADAALYMQRNGFSVQWWSPTFGGGLPVFANPQDLQLSLPQFFTLFTNPFIAICISYSVVTLASCYALHRLARRVLDWDESSACLLAVVGSTGGFLTLRMIVGHASYHGFALTPVLLLLAMDRRIRPRIGVPLAGLVATYFVYSGGYFVSFAAPLALGLAIPVVRLLAVRSRPLLPALGVLAGGAAIALAISAAKLYAAFSYLKQFPRAQVIEPLPSLLSPLLQLLGTPVLTLFGIGGTPSELHRTLFEQGWGPWETDASLFLPVTVAACIGLPILVAQIYRTGTHSERGLTCLALLVGCLLLILTSGRGPIFELLTKLPGVSNFRVTARFASAFALPVCLVGVFVLSHVAARWRSSTRRDAILWSLVGLALLQQAGYWLVVSRFPNDVGVSYDARLVIEASDRQRADPDLVPPIRSVARVTDPVAFATSRSSLYVYESLLGSYVRDYGSFLRRTPLVSGPASQVQNGKFNIHFPPAFVYAEELQRRPFSRITESDRNALELFLAGRDPGWELPRTQRMANTLSVSALALTLAWLAALLQPWIRVGARPVEMTGK